jgi:predicted dehydrogenase
MSDGVTRRDFVKGGSAAAFLSQVPLVHAGGQEATVKIGLVGCGGRGTGAAENCLASSPNVQLIAMADMFKDRMDTSRKLLSEKDGYKVKDDLTFTGFDAYKKILDTPIDLVLLATPPGFRPIHFAAAVEAGKHVFMEKPCAVDPVGVRKVIETGEKAKAKKLAVLPGTQYRHQVSFVETVKRIHGGAIGEIRSGRAYYNSGTLWDKPRTKGMSEMEWQLRNWLYFDWLSGDQPVEQHIHTIDVTDWVMNAHPVRAVATGGRQVRTGEKFGNVYDHFTIDYEYPGGVHVMSMCRQMANVANHVGAYFEGTKGSAAVYAAKIKGIGGAPDWAFDGEISIGKAYVQEHADLIKSIRAGQPVNEARRIAETTLTAIMGREAAYTGKVVTWDEMTKSDLDLSPEKYEMGDNPVRPVPMPGQDRA